MWAMIPKERIKSNMHCDIPGTYKTQERPCHCGPGPHMFKVYSR